MCIRRLEIPLGQHRFAGITWETGAGLVAPLDLRYTDQLFIMRFCRIGMSKAGFYPWVEEEETHGYQATFLRACQYIYEEYEGTILPDRETWEGYNWKRTDV